HHHSVAQLFTSASVVFNRCRSVTLYSVILFFSFFHCDRHLRDLHSFPTRRSSDLDGFGGALAIVRGATGEHHLSPPLLYTRDLQDRKSTRLNSSHSQISYAVFCLKKKKTQ